MLRYLSHIAKYATLVAGISLISSFATAADRQIERTQNADYYGFDLRTEKDVTLDQCESICLDDKQCKAFTYNTKAHWCFLKSDFKEIHFSDNAIAGKIYEPAAVEADLGAPNALAFFPDYMRSAAQKFKQDLSKLNSNIAPEALESDARIAIINGDPRTARELYQQALSQQPDNQALWQAFAEATLATEPINYNEQSQFKRDAVTAGWFAYQNSRTQTSRAQALATLAAALERNNLSRPALQAYEASLELMNSAAVHSAYQELKARKGFRVLDNTVDNDASNPRICVQFSEELVKNGVDYSSYIQLDGKIPPAIEAKNRQICVEGLEHGKHYNVTLRSGLPAAIGETLPAPINLSVYVKDRSPSIRFTGDSFVLPAKARRGLPMVSINMDEAKLNLYRIGDRSLARLLTSQHFLRQLDGYDLNTITNDLGTPIWNGDIELVSAELNKEAVTSFPVDEALPKRQAGVYVLTAENAEGNSESYASKASQWFVVSDIGLTTYTGQDGISVFARSLETAKPLSGITLTLLASNNEVLGEATTDNEGRAIFSAGLSRGEGGMLPAVVMANKDDEDFVFLDLTRAGFDLSDRGVTGRAAPENLDIFMWSERGIYRAGEIAYIGALARNQSADAVEDLPLTFIFSRPDGVEERRIIVDNPSKGGYALELPLSTNAMRGTWSVAAYTDPKLAPLVSQIFLVEDFVPDRIEFDLKSDVSEIRLGNEAQIQLDGRYLYGAPAADLSLEGTLTLSTTRYWDKFPRYVFGLADEGQNEATRIDLEGLPSTDQNGHSDIAVLVDQTPSTTQLVNANITIRMREGGGRAVERKLDLPVKPQTDLIGIRPDFSGDEVAQGSIANFNIISVSPSGDKISLENASWSLVKIERNYQWYRNGSGWTYEPVTHSRAVADGKLNISSDADTLLSLPVDWGRYQLEITSSHADGPVTSYEFNAGWFVSAQSTETPDGLEIALDKEQYEVGDVAKLQISPRFAGELLIAIGNEKLLKTLNATVPAEGTIIDIPVDEAWGAGAYVTATLFRPGSAQENRMPARAIGLKWLKIDPADKSLKITLSPPEKTEPRQTLSIPVSVANAGNEQAYVMVAAVDVGILNLTRYQAPDPIKWFFGQRELGLELRDMYGRLIDGSLGITGRLRTGGDGGNMATQGSPPKEKLVAFFSKIIELDAEGRAVIDFDIPQFNGTAKIMAVAWTSHALGHASSDVIIRDPVVIQASMPRFMAPGDEAQMRIDISNTDAPSGNYNLDISTSDNLSIHDDSYSKTVSLQNGGKQSLIIPLSAIKTGDGLVTISLSAESGKLSEQILNLPVRPVDLPVTAQHIISLKPNGGSFVIDEKLLANSLLDGAYITAGVTTSAALDVPSLLTALDRYPYGCSEQTTSRAMPLLYWDELAAHDFQLAGLDNQEDLNKRIQDAIYRVINNQSSTGSFGMWGPGYGDLWLDAYISDFLTRAREKSYHIPEKAMILALGNLANTISYTTDVQSRGNEIAYALYVLARNKKAVIGDLRYYADAQIENFSSPMAVAQLASALAFYGDQQRAQQLLNIAYQKAVSAAGFDDYRSDYGSRLRDSAALLALAAEIKPLPSIVPQLIDLVKRQRGDAAYLSTQDQAWMLMAARALKEQDETISLDINGVQHNGALFSRFNGEMISQAPQKIVNIGGQQVDAVVTALAPPAQSLPAGGNGFAITRTYYTLDGTETDPTSVSQNERFVVVLNIEDMSQWQSRVLVTDLLPSGFEIDNPSLISSADLANFSWLENTQAAHLEFRDDRFVAAFDRPNGAKPNITLAYIVRAVTPGLYTQPAATVEDMYRPHFSARTATGMMEIVQP